MNNILIKYDEITDNKFVIALTLFIFIIPMGLLETAYSYLPMLKIRFIFGILVLIKFFIHFKENKKFPTMLLVSVIYVLGRFIRTYIATGLLKSSLLDYSSLIILPLVMLVESNIEHNTNNFIEGALIYIEAVILLNIFCIFIPSFSSLFSDGSILGFDNYHFAYYSIALPIAYINYYLNRNKLNFYNMIVLYVLIILFSIKYWSATNLVAVFVFFISLFISKYTKVANIITYIGTYFASFIGLVLLKVHHLFSFLIVDVLHKDITLSLRDQVWRDFKTEIVKSPIIGYGYNNNELFNPEQNQMLYAHNHILQEIFNGGIIMYLIYIWFVILPAKKLWENRNNVIAKVLSSIIFAILVHSLCESLNPGLFIFIYTIAYNVEALIKQEKVNCNE